MHSAATSLVQKWSSRPERRNWYRELRSGSRLSTGKASRQGLRPNILRASAQVPSSSTNNGRFAHSPVSSTGGATACTTRSGAAYCPGNTR